MFTDTVVLHLTGINVIIGYVYSGEGIRKVDWGWYLVWDKIWVQLHTHGKSFKDIYREAVVKNQKYS